MCEDVDPFESEMRCAHTGTHRDGCAVCQGPRLNENEEPCPRELRPKSGEQAWTPFAKWRQRSGIVKVTQRVVGKAGGGNYKGSGKGKDKEKL